MLAVAADDAVARDQERDRVVAERRPDGAHRLRAGRSRRRSSHTAGPRPPGSRAPCAAPPPRTATGRAGRRAPAPTDRRPAGGRRPGQAAAASPRPARGAARSRPRTGPRRRFGSSASDTTRHAAAVPGDEDLVRPASRSARRRRRARPRASSGRRALPAPSRGARRARLRPPGRAASFGREIDWVMRRPPGSECARRSRGRVGVVAETGRVGRGRVRRPRRRPAAGSSPRETCALTVPSGRSSTAAISA